MNFAKLAFASVSTN